MSIKNLINLNLGVFSSDIVAIENLSHEEVILKAKNEIEFLDGKHVFLLAVEYCNDQESECYEIYISHSYDKTISFIECWIDPDSVKNIFLFAEETIEDAYHRLGM